MSATEDVKSWKVRRSLHGDSSNQLAAEAMNMMRVLLTTLMFYLDLEAFKEVFGHCNVPQRYAGNPSLGRWCSTTRSAYNATQKGLNRHTTKLTPARITRLQEIGFKWSSHDASFEQHCLDLEAFKEVFGHCNVPERYAGNPSLGKWCSNIRTAYKKKNLSPERITRLQEIGFFSPG